MGVVNHTRPKAPALAGAAWPRPASLGLALRFAAPPVSLYGMVSGNAARLGRRWPALMVALPVLLAIINLDRDGQNLALLRPLFAEADPPPNLLSNPAKFN